MRGTSADVLRVEKAAQEFQAELQEMLDRIREELREQTEQKLREAIRKDDGSRKGSFSLRGIK